MNEPIVCIRCSNPKIQTEMAIRYHKHGRKTLRNHCQECQRKSQQKSAHKNNQYKSRVKEWRQDIYNENTQYIVNYLKEHPCVDCGAADLIILEFDHVRGHKSFNLSYGIWQHRLPKIIAEIEKCDVRCPNCHRRKTMATQLTGLKLA